jgi:hypothetical protein
MTLRITARTRDELEARIWATTARPWMRRTRSLAAALVAYADQAEGTK